MPEARVLVVDLDGTLIKTDLFYESFWSAISLNARTAASTLAAIFRGRAHLKAQLSGRIHLDPARLPYNESVLDMVKSWRQGGGRTVLCTASDQRYARAIADHLGLFDEVHASDGSRNLKSRLKADFLCDRFGEDQYDYIGDSRSDLPVWKRARRAVTVGAPAALRKSVSNISKDVQHLDTVRPGPRDYLKALRPHQWSKNVLVFLPVLAAHETASDRIIAAFLAFVAFSLIASSVYVLNDLLDLAADRAHPRKRNRPLASGAIPLAHGSLMVPTLLLLGGSVAVALHQWTFLGVMLGYYVLAIAYSVTLKRKLIIDICALAGLYSMRIVAGGAATGLNISVWLLAFSIFFFMSLAAIKRQAELVDGVVSGRDQALRRAYHVDDLPIVAMIAIASGYVSVLVLALYINSDAVQTLYRDPKLLWGVCPILLYWISRMVMMAHRGTMDDDPIVFAVKDRVSQLCGLLIGGIMVAGSLL